MLIILPLDIVTIRYPTEVIFDLKHLYSNHRIFRR